MGEVIYFTASGRDVFVLSNTVRFRITLSGSIVVMYKYFREKIHLASNVTESKSQGPVEISERQLDNAIELIEDSIELQAPKAPPKTVYHKEGIMPGTGKGGIYIDVYSEYILLKYRHEALPRVSEGERDIEISNDNVHDFLHGLKVLRSKILEDKLLDH